MILGTLVLVMGLAAIFADYVVRRQMKIAQLFILPLCIILLIGFGFALFDGGTQGDITDAFSLLLLPYLATAIAAFVLYRTIVMNRKINRIIELLEKR